MHRYHCIDTLEEIINPATQSRLLIRLTRSSDRLMNIWEISHFIENYFGYYYKYYLLTYISSALDYGISPDNIFILDRSLSPNNFSGIDSLNHISLFDESTDDRIYQLYSLGRPFSLFPNLDIFLINQIFFYCRSINEFLYEQKCNTLRRGFISEHTKLVINQKMNYYKFLNTLSHYALSQLKFLNNDKLSDKLGAIINNAKLGYENFLNENKPNFSNSTQVDSEYSQKESFSAPNIFFNYLARVKRPLIGIYYDKLKMIQILGLSHINSDSRDSSFLDLKNMGHNSPSFLDFIGETINSIGTLKNDNAIYPKRRYLMKKMADSYKSIEEGADKLLISNDFNVTNIDESI